MIASLLQHAGYKSGSSNHGCESGEAYESDDFDRPDAAVKTICNHVMHARCLVNHQECNKTNKCPFCSAALAPDSPVTDLKKTAAEQLEADGNLAVEMADAQRVYAEDHSLTEEEFARRGLRVQEMKDRADELRLRGSTDEADELEKNAKELENAIKSLRDSQARGILNAPLVDIDKARNEYLAWQHVLKTGHYIMERCSAVVKEFYDGESIFESNIDIKLFLVATQVVNDPNCFAATRARLYSEQLINDNMETLYDDYLDAKAIAADTVLENVWIRQTYRFVNKYGVTFRNMKQLNGQEHDEDNYVTDSEKLMAIYTSTPEAPLLAHDVEPMESTDRQNGNPSLIAKFNEFKGDKPYKTVYKKYLDCLTKAVVKDGPHNLDEPDVLLAIMQNATDMANSEQQRGGARDVINWTAAASLMAVTMITAVCSSMSS